MKTFDSITSFTAHVSGVARLSATYLKANEEGNVMVDNERFNVIVIDPEIQEAIDKINNYLKDKIPEGAG